MRIGAFEIYLLIINFIGFILFAINTWLYTNTPDGQIDILLTIASLLGGSAGIVLAILIMDRKIRKGTMMSRVFVACVLVIQIVFVLYFKGVHGEEVSFAIWDFFKEHEYIIIYLIAINIMSIVLFGIDKIHAIEGKSRIRIITLLGIAFLGGSIGEIIAMYAFRHKTKKDYFTIGVPLILAMQIVLILYLTNL